MRVHVYVCMCVHASQSVQVVNQPRVLTLAIEHNSRNHSMCLLHVYVSTTRVYINYICIHMYLHKYMAKLIHIEWFVPLAGGTLGCEELENVPREHPERTWSQPMGKPEYRSCLINYFSRLPV